MKAALTAIPQDIVAALDYARHAREHLDENAWTYLNSGAADELTLRENEAAFQRLQLRNRVLVDASGGNTRLELFGHRYEHPIFLAPVAYQRLFHPDGERATVLAAGAMAAGMVVSTLASTTLEEVAASASSPLWFQLYTQRDRSATLALVRRAEALGYVAIVVTVDAPIAGVRNREQRAGFHLPANISAVNLVAVADNQSVALKEGQSLVFDGLMANAPTWADIEWLLKETKLPVLLKGILDPADAVKAKAMGVGGLVVSNHGGRSVDSWPATIDALPRIVAAVDGAIPVLLDGGIRRGTDIYKAMALGATAVFVGRPYVYALATAGALGVAHLIRLLREELEITMALCGRTTLASIDRSALW